MGRVAEVKVQAHTRREEAGMKFSGIGSHSLQRSPKKVGDDENRELPKAASMADCG